MHLRWGLGIPDKNVLPRGIVSQKKIRHFFSMPARNAFGSHTTFKDGEQVHLVPIQPLKDGGANALENAFKGHSCPLR